MSASVDGVYEPGVVDPGLPVDDATSPFWHSQPSPIHNVRSLWVDQADVVIIGSGITGASVARKLFSTRPKLKIVMLEARSICSGATGRNGGHIKVMSYNVWFHRKEKHGLVEAIRWTNFEHNHLRSMAECIEEEGIDCDFKLQEGVDAYYDESTFKRALHAVNDMRKFACAAGNSYTIYTAEEAVKKFKCTESCVGAIGVPAAALWPYKMVSGLLQNLMNEYDLHVHTATKVLAIQDEDRSRTATVRTTRGIVNATHIVHATNAWLGHLVPELRQYISPVRGNVIRQKLANSSSLPDNTFWLRYGEKDYDYMIPRPDNSIIIGRANLGRRATSDDSTVDLLPQAHLAVCIPEVIKVSQYELEVTDTWSGILGFTQDQNPFVGRLPFSGKAHQFVCGGYHGIGMIKAFIAGQILGSMILNEDIPEPFPRSMLLDSTRLSALRASLKLASHKL